MSMVLPYLMLAVGLALGAAIGWLALRVRSAAQTGRFAAAEAALADLNQLRDFNLILEREKAALTATLEQERRQTLEKLALVEQAEKKLSDAFKSLAAEALQSNNQSFLNLAKTALETQQESAKGDLEKRQLAIGAIVTPVKEALTKVEEKIQALEVAREGAYAGLVQEVKTLQEGERLLRAETSNLVRALRTPGVRGRWGEVQLRRVAELAGMIDHCDFFEQVHTETDNGCLRPDMIVCLPGERRIVVDAKTPLYAFLEAIDAPDDDARRDRMKEHARLVRDHVNKLKRKDYRNQFEESPDFVVLFLPGETFFSAALEHDPSLIENSFEQGVVLATPTTLITLLRTVALAWRQEKLNRNAQEISELGKQLYERLAKLSEHMHRLGSNLKASVKTYNETVGTLETRVLVSARKFRELGATPNQEIEELEPLEVTTRVLQRHDFFGDDFDSDDPLLESRS